MDSYFGRADRVRQEENGRIVNPVPLWTNDKYINDLEADIRKINQQEKEGFLSTKEKANKVARKVRLETLLRNIKDSDPRNHNINKDSVERVETSIRQKIKDISPYYQEDVKKPSVHDNGVESNPAEEGQKAKTPCIRLDTEEELAEAQKANLKIENKMISRDDAKRMCRLLALAVGKRVGFQQFRHHMAPGQRSNRSLSYSEQGRENHDRIFGEDIKQPSNTVTISKDEYDELQASRKKKPRKPAEYWSCPECDFQGTTRNKGIHLAQHRLKEKKEAKKNLVEA